VSLPNGNVLPLSIDELKEKFEVIEMPVTLMCAGNRRSEFNAQVKDKKVNVRSQPLSSLKIFSGSFMGPMRYFDSKMERRSSHRYSRARRNFIPRM